jgi:hypothetical protein
MGLVGQAPAFEHLRTRLRKLAGAEGPVLISGETGTGEELVAHAIHQARSSRPASTLDSRSNRHVQESTRFLTLRTTLERRRCKAVATHRKNVGDDKQRRFVVAPISGSETRRAESKR